MRQLFYKLALSTALISGAAAIAQADCYSKTVSTGNNATFQLAQAGGGGGGGTGGGSTGGGTGSTTGNSGSGTSGTGAGSSNGTSSSGTSPNSTSGGGAADTVIPKDRRMRSPDTPGMPPQPGTGQTSR